MLNSKSDFALNKMDKEATVYMDSNGAITRLTQSSFDNPEDFQRWKSWSDTDYHEREKETHIFSNHTIPVDGDSLTVQSAEDILIAIQDQQEHRKLLHLLMSGLDSCLTPTQRRLWLACAEGLTMRQIAHLEGTTHQGVVKSVRAAKINIKNFMAGEVAKTLF